MHRFCEVCRDRLTAGEQLQGLVRTRPICCRFTTITGAARAIQARWVCDHCVKDYRDRAGQEAADPPPVPAASPSTEATRV